MTEKEFNDMRPLYEVFPRTDWASLWEKLETLGILTLPDASTLPNVKRFLDGITYIVEINDGGSYRTYMYNDLEHQDFSEAKQMIEIIKTLQDEFQNSMPRNARASP